MWMDEGYSRGRSCIYIKRTNKPGKQVACNCSLGTFLGPAADARKIHDYLTPTHGQLTPADARALGEPCVGV